jgi:hypothetical protein
VVEIIEEEIGNGCLGRGGAQRGVRIGSAGRGVEARIRNTPLPYFAIVAFDVF